MDLHAELSQHAKANAADASRHLRDPDTETLLAERVDRGRRRRTTKVSALAASGVAVIALTAVLATQGWSGAENPVPGDTDHSGVDSDVPDVVWDNGAAASDPEFVLGMRDDGAVVCGAEWDYSAGTYAHTDFATSAVTGVRAAPEFRIDGEQVDAPPDPFDPERARLDWAFEVTKDEAHGPLEFQMLGVAVSDGVIVGTSVPAGGSGGGGWMRSGIDGAIPGVCSTQAGVAPDGDYEQHLIVQVVHATSFEPIATLIDPGGAVDLTYEGLPQPSDPDYYDDLQLDVNAPLPEALQCGAPWRWVPGSAMGEEFSGAQPAEMAQGITRDANVDFEDAEYLSDGATVDAREEPGFVIQPRWIPFEGSVTMQYAVIVERDGTIVGGTQGSLYAATIDSQERFEGDVPLATSWATWSQLPMPGGIGCPGWDLRDGEYTFHVIHQVMTSNPVEGEYGRLLHTTIVDSDHFPMTLNVTGLSDD